MTGHTSPSQPASAREEGSLSPYAADRDQSPSGIAPSAIMQSREVATVDPATTAQDQYLAMPTAGGSYEASNILAPSTMMQRREASSAHPAPTSYPYSNRPGVYTSDGFIRDEPPVDINSSNRLTPPSPLPPRKRRRQGNALSPTMAAVHSAISETLDAVAPLEAIERRSSFGDSRYHMSLLFNESMAAPLGTQKHNAYEQAFLAHYYLSIGRTAWKYLPAELRQEYVNNFSAAWIAPVNCPQDLARASSSILNSLQTINTLAERRGVDNLNLPEEELDASDWAYNPQVGPAAITVAKTLHKCMINNEVYPGNQSVGQVLQQVRSLLGCRIGFYAKIEMLAKAMVVWPDEDFESDSPALDRFIQENEEYLVRMGAEESEDSKARVKAIWAREEPSADEPSGEEGGGA